MGVPDRAYGRHEMAIRTVIAEDNLLVRVGLARLLETQSDIEVVGACGDLTTLLATADAEAPDVVVTDIEMPGMGGLELAAEVRRRASGARIVILTTFARAGYLRRALDAGASGFVGKDAPSTEVVRAARHACFELVGRRNGVSPWWSK